MSDTGRRQYGYLQNASDQGVLADALVGERAGNVTAHQVNAAHGPARFSTAPYKPPKPKPDAVTGPTCHYKNCKQTAIDGYRYCERHQV